MDRYATTAHMQAPDATTQRQLEKELHLPGLGPVFAANWFNLSQAAVEPLAGIGSPIQRVREARSIQHGLSMSYTAKREPFVVRNAKEWEAVTKDRLQGIMANSQQVRSIPLHLHLGACFTASYCLLLRTTLSSPWPQEQT